MIFIQNPIAQDKITLASTYFACADNSAGVTIKDTVFYNNYTFVKTADGSVNVPYCNKNSVDEATSGNEFRTYDKSL